MDFFILQAPKCANLNLYIKIIIFDLISRIQFLRNDRTDQTSVCLEVKKRLIEMEKLAEKRVCYLPV